MASIEYINKRIAGKEAELEKLNKKLARIIKAKETGWSVNPYYYSERDLQYTTKDIEIAEKVLADYKAKLVTETEKAGSRNVQVIIDFLENWKVRVRRHYELGLAAYFRDKADVRAAYNRFNTLPYGSDEYTAAKAEYEELNTQFRIACHGEYKREPYIDRWGKTRYTEIKIADGEYESLFPYNGFRTIEEAMEKLNKDLDQEATRKYDFIIERTNKIVGQITDASNLKVGAKDDLNGYIIGTKGTAKVKTIGAGGYNIQCFHFRTLINPMK